MIVAPLICSIVAGFYLGGAGLGLAVGAMAASSVILWAVHDPPRATIVPPVAVDGRGRLLFLVDGAVGAVAVGAAALTLATAAEALEMSAVVPLRLGRLERRTSDTDKGRGLAEGRLAMMVSIFERAGLRSGGSRRGGAGPGRRGCASQLPGDGRRTALGGAGGGRRHAGGRLTVPFGRLGTQVRAGTLSAASLLDRV